MKRYLCAAVFAASVLTASVMATNPAPGDTPPKAENAFQKSVPIDSGQATLTVYSQAKKLPPAMEPAPNHVRGANDVVFLCANGLIVTNARNYTAANNISPNSYAADLSLASSASENPNNYAAINASGNAPNDSALNIALDTSPHAGAVIT